MLFNGSGDLNWQNWDAVGAMATVFATAVALIFSWLALRAPMREGQRQRRESTLEVLRATEAALASFAELEQMVTEPGWDDRKLARQQVKADHGKRALEHLIQRPSLTDGAIFTAAGAIAILDLVLSVESEAALVSIARARATGAGFEGAVFVEPKRRARERVEDGATVVDVTKDRADRVRRYLEEGKVRRMIRHARRRLARWRTKAA